MLEIALCYVRKSFVRTASDEISPERQRANIIAEAERHGFVARFFEDAEGHRSGRNENRPGWKSLKSHLDDPEVKAVIVESLSRASRSIRDLFNFIAELEKRGITLISLKEKFDTNSAMGRAFLGVIAILNQFESDVASERMKMTVAHIQTVRKQHWGFVPFGCAREKSNQKLVASREGIWRVGNAVVVGESNALPFTGSVSARGFGYLDAVRKGLEIYTTSDIGFQDLAEQLNTLGFLYRDRYGVPRPFHTDDVRRIVDLVEIYAGHLPQKGTKDNSMIMDAHPPILPRDLCDKVVVVREERHGRFRRFGTTPKRAKRVYLLVNLYCAECGSHLHGQFEHGDRYYRHSKQIKHQCSQPDYVRAEIIEVAMFDRLECFQAPEEMKARIRAKVRDLAKQPLKPEWENARRQLVDLDKKLERLKTLFVDTDMDKSEYEKRKAKIDEQKRTFSQILQSAPLDAKKLETLLPKIDQMASIIREGTQIQQREAFTALFERIEILGSKVTKATPRDWARPFCNGDET